MNVLSLDQAFRLSGYAVWKDSELIEVGHKGFSSLGEQLTFLSLLLEQHQIDIVIFEDVQLQVNPQVFKTLSQVQGAIIGFLELRKIPYEIYAPVSWRSKINLKAKNRAEAKRKAVELCRAKWPDLKFTQDSSEAALIGLAYLTPKPSAF